MGRDDLTPLNLAMIIDSLGFDFMVVISRMLIPFTVSFFRIILLLLVPFSYKLLHHLKPFAIVVLNGEITVYSVDAPNGFEW